MFAKWATLKPYMFSDFISQPELMGVLGLKHRVQMKRWAHEWQAKAYRITSRLTLYRRLPVLHYIEWLARGLPTTEFTHTVKLAQTEQYPLAWREWVPHPMATEIMGVPGDYATLYRWTTSKKIYNPVRMEFAWGHRFFNVVDLQNLKAGFK